MPGASRRTPPPTGDSRLLPHALSPRAGSENRDSDEEPAPSLTACGGLQGAAQDIGLFIAGSEATASLPVSSMLIGHELSEEPPTTPVFRPVAPAAEAPPWRLEPLALAVAPGPARQAEEMRIARERAERSPQAGDRSRSGPPALPSGQPLVYSAYTVRVHASALLNGCSSDESYEAAALACRRATERGLADRSGVQLPGT